MSESNTNSQDFQNKDQSDYFTPEELALKINMSVKFIQTNTQLRKIPGQTKIGRLWRYRRSEVEKRLLLGSEQFLLPNVRCVNAEHRLSSSTKSKGSMAESKGGE